MGYGLPDMGAAGILFPHSDVFQSTVGEAHTKWHTFQIRMQTISADDLFPILCYLSVSFEESHRGRGHFEGAKEKKS